MDYDYSKLVFDSYNNAFGNNYDLEIMHDSNDFINYVKQGLKMNGYQLENGAVLVITEKQYILSYNLGKGQKGHNSTLSRIHAKLNGIDSDYKLREELQFQTELSKKFLHARIYADMTSDYSIYRHIIFTLKREKISEAEFKVFMEFYNNYAAIIKKYNFRVGFNKMELTIDELKDYLETIIDYSLENISSEDEIIIGAPVTSAIKK